MEAAVLRPVRAGRLRSPSRINREIKPPSNYLFQIMSSTHDIYGEERRQDLWEDNPDISSAFEFPSFDECPILRSSLGSLLMKEINRLINVQGTRMAAAILALPEDQRRIFMLHAHERISLRDIAKLFGKTDHHWVIRRLNMARKAVADAMTHPTGRVDSEHSCMFPMKERPKAPSIRDLRISQKGQ